MGFKKAITKKTAKKTLKQLKKADATKKPASKGKKKKSATTKKVSDFSYLKNRKASNLLNEYAQKHPFAFTEEKKITRDASGRPTVMTQEVVRKLETAFCYDASVEEACFVAGIARSTYYKFIELYPAFSDRVAELKEAAVYMCRQTILAAAEADPDMAMKYVERKRKIEFSLRSEVAHSGEINNKHTISPEVESLMKQAMGNFLSKADRLKKKEKQNGTATTASTQQS